MGDTQSVELSLPTEQNFGARAKESSRLDVFMVIDHKGRRVKLNEMKLYQIYDAMTNLKHHAEVAILNLSEMGPDEFTEEFCANTLDTIEAGMDKVYEHQWKPLTSPDVKISYRRIRPRMKEATKTKSAVDLLKHIKDVLEDEESSAAKRAEMRKLYGKVNALTTLYKWIRQTDEHIEEYHGMLRKLSSHCKGKEHAKARKAIKLAFQEIASSMKKNHSKKRKRVD
jgi:hypothetical protein